tara:strand:+ start:322 stop:1110 length:789 start_codon:yes stop_codon:yes gene_type:complete
MPKNIIFLVNIQLGERSKPEFQYSIDSWKHWATNNNAEVVVLTEAIHDIDYMKPNWQKWYVFDLLEESNIDYNKVLVVDADTIVHPDCPNFFDLTEDNELGCVVNEGCYEWVARDMNNWSTNFFDNMYLPQWEYFNSGFMLLSKKHKPVIKKLLEWYHNNASNINLSQNEFKTSTEQGPLNFLLRKWGVDIKLLPSCYNTQDLFKKNTLNKGYKAWSDEFLFFKAGWIYHFNAIPHDLQQYGYHGECGDWIKLTYEKLYKNA